jgi:hypothetical protein
VLASGAVAVAGVAAAVAGVAAAAVPADVTTAARAVIVVAKVWVMDKRIICSRQSIVVNLATPTTGVRGRI